MTSPHGTRIDWVLTRGFLLQFYVVQVRGEGGGPAVSEDALTGRLASILAEPTAANGHPPVGILTSQRRDKWAAARDHLIKGE